MEVIPAIDIRGGRCVRLYQGDFAQETVFAEDPAEVATRFQELGAPRLHVVDLDGARAGHPVNSEALRRLLATATVPVQVGGGLRRLADVEACLGMGAEAAVLGTAAVRDPALLSAALERFPGQVMVAIDAREGRVAVAGWRETTDVPAVELARQLAAMGVARLVYTDILRDGTLGEPNFAAIQELAAAVEARLIASGGIARLEHLRRLAEMGVAGAIVGRALYSGELDLRQALAALDDLGRGQPAG